MLMFFPSKPDRILQAKQNFACPNFCRRFVDEQNQIPEFPQAFIATPI
jgi:hypothetical protein